MDEKALVLPPDEDVVATLERWEAERQAAKSFDEKRRKAKEQRAW